MREVEKSDGDTTMRETIEDESNFFFFFFCNSANNDENFVYN